MDGNSSIQKDDCIKKNDRIKKDDSLIVQVNDVKPSKLIQDKYNLCCVYATFFGICSLLPWNCLLVSNSFFKSKINDGPNLTLIYDSTFTSCANITVVISFVINLLYIYKFNRSLRAYISLGMILSGFFLLTIFIPIDTNKFARVFFTIIILTTIFLSFASTIVQSTFFAIFAYFPPNYLGLYFTGQAFSGLVAVIIQLIVTASNLPESRSPYIFFISVLVILVAALISYRLFVRTEFYKYTMRQAEISGATTSKDTVEQKKDLSFRNVVKTYRKLLKQLAIPASTIFVTFFVTLFLFPVLPLRWQSTSTNKTWKNRYYLDVVVFLIFNIGDTLGRIFVRYVQWPKGNSILLPIFTSLRIFFVFPFVMCNLNPMYSATFLPTLFRNDFFPALFMFLFSFTNGYYPSIVFATAPSMVSPAEAEFCNTLLVLLLGVGLSVGSFMSFLI